MNGNAPELRARPLPRLSLAIVAALHAAIFGWAGWMLPWTTVSVFSIACYALAIGHAATAIAALHRARWLPPIWRATSGLSLLALAYVSFEVIRAAATLASLYGGLGEGIAAALLAGIGLFALVTLPIAAWGFGATARRSDPVKAAVALAIFAAVVGGSSAHAAAEVRALALPGARAAEADPLGAVRDAFVEARRELVPDWQALPEPPEPKGIARRFRRSITLFDPSPVECAPAIDAEEATAVVAFVGPRGEARPRVVRRCVKAKPEDLPRAVMERVRDEAYAGPVAVDVYRGVAELESRMPLFDALALRPGLDGVCSEQKCLLPSQLVATKAFVAEQPIAEIPDFRFGFSAEKLRKTLGLEASPGLDGLLRLETHAIEFDASGEAVALVRGRERDVPLTRARLEEARSLAEAHVLAAQRPDGLFRYLLDPHTGRSESAGWNLPRQAGTTLVVCELGRDTDLTREAAQKALGFMAQYARREGELVALSRDRGTTAALGSIALPAIAFFTCLPHVDESHDALLAGMTRALLALQREDGGFHPWLDLTTGRAEAGPEPLYAGGQAIYALSLAEKFVIEEGERAARAGFPGKATLRAAVEGAMGYYAGPYWDTFVRDFFWIEENWHCLAARASLGHHRNDAYERFCLDYVAFKTRVILDEESGVAPELVGGYGMGNIFVPQTTPTAGFGEALAAAMALREARGECLEESRQTMRLVLGFLLRQQWNPRNAATSVRAAIGGFSESMVSPEIRIDFTQHAWAALGHGGAYLEAELPHG